MVKDSKANGTAAGGWASEEEWHFELIQPAIIRSPDRRIAGSPDRRIAGSPDRRIAGSPDRRIAPDRPCVFVVPPLRAIGIPA